MILSPNDVDQVRQKALDQDLAGLASLQWQGMTLGALFELACCWWEWTRTGDAKALDLAQRWADQRPELRRAWHLLSQRQAPRVSQEDLYGAPAFEFWPAPREDEISDQGWLLFQGRFKRSLQQRGFGTKMALALSKAMGDMADNVVQHSAKTTASSAPGIVGYHVGARSMTYAVADVGRGVLDSLRENPKWSGLQNSKIALREAICNFATRRADRKVGNGFQDVHKSLVDLNGDLRFRSGDGVLTMKGASERREGVGEFTAPLCGFQLCVTCSLEDNAEELFL